MIRILSLFLFLVVASTHALSQDRYVHQFTLADTVSWGGLDIHFYQPWSFSFEKPSQIVDGYSLRNTIPVVPSDFSNIKKLPKWERYGWLETEVVVDSSISSRNWLFTYHDARPIKVWLNGRCVVQFGNPSREASDEILAPYSYKEKEITLKPGSNFILIETSDHSVPYGFAMLKPYVNRIGFHIQKVGATNSHSQNYRVFVFGAATLIFISIALIHFLLAYKFPRQKVHRYILLTTAFMLIHVMSGLSESYFGWTFSFIYFQEFGYNYSYACGLFFYILSIREMFNLQIPIKIMSAVLGVALVSLTYVIFVDFSLQNSLFLFWATIGLGYGLYSMREAQKTSDKNEVLVIFYGLLMTLMGAAGYLIVFVILGHQNQNVYVISVLMAYASIPFSLTLNIANNYISLFYSLEHKVRERTRDLEESNAFKTRFFANISHEFRTPLTISAGLIERLLKRKMNPDMALDLRIADRNLARLKDMVNQIIDLTKSDNTRLILKKQETYGDKIATMSVESFRSLAESKNQRLIFESQCSDVVIDADVNRFEMIVNNLISNAIKYTPENGWIEVITYAKDSTYFISVRDDGPGIPADQQEVIFERFHRIQNESADYVEGMGIGLELSRTLARLHNGDIELTSGSERGATFVVHTPIKRHESPAPDDFQNEVFPNEFLAENASVSSQKYQILLTEDNADMRSYLTQILSEIGEVTTANNGKEALAQIEKRIPDILITDLMMPVMDGHKLVETLTKNEKTRKIPVVVLTAKSLEKDRLDLLRIGVVDYVVKPFLAEELILKINNLLSYYEKRKKVELVVDGSDLGESEDVIKKASAFVYANLDNTNISTELLADELGVSRRTLYRILESETGTTPAIFIREIRLLAARKLLELQKNLTLEQVSHQVGYRSVKNFKKLYLERFGVHPLDEKQK